MSHIFYFTLDGVRMHLDTGVHFSQALYYPRDGWCRSEHEDGFFRFVVYAAAHLHAGRALLTLMHDSGILDDERLDAAARELWANWRGWLVLLAEDQGLPRTKEAIEERLRDYHDKISDFFICDEHGSFVFRGGCAAMRGND